MINVALLGFGRIGQMHAQNINKNKNLKLLYVYEKIEELGKKHQSFIIVILKKIIKKYFLIKT